MKNKSKRQVFVSSQTDAPKRSKQINEISRHEFQFRIWQTNKPHRKSSQIQQNYSCNKRAVLVARIVHRLCI